MNRSLKVIIYYKSISDDALASFAAFVATSLTANAHFPAPPVTAAALQTMADNFRNAVLEAGTKDRNKIAQKNTQRAALLIALRTVGTYVNSVAENNLDALVSSGFKLSKTPEPRHLTVLENFTVVRGNTEGSIISKVNGNPAAFSFVHMAAPVPVTESSVWITATSTRSKHMFTNLQPGVEYCFKVKAYGTNNQSATTGELIRLVA